MYSKKKLSEKLSLLFAMVLILGILLQPASSVFAISLPPDLTIKPVTAAGDLIKGGKYEVYKIATIGDDGAETAITPELIGSTDGVTFSETDGYKIKLASGRYRIEVRQVKRAPGYLLTNYSATKTEGTVTTDEVVQGYIAQVDVLHSKPKGDIIINHKQERITLDANIEKLDQTGAPITDGANVITFNHKTKTWARSASYVPNGPSAATEDVNPKDGQLDLPADLSVTLDATGKLQLPGLEEGTYELTETATKPGLNLMDKPIGIEVKPKAGKEDIAASEDDFEIVYNGDTVNTKYNSAEGKLSVTNFNEPTIDKDAKLLTEAATEYGKVIHGDLGTNINYKMSVTLPNNATSYEKLFVTDDVPAEFEVVKEGVNPKVAVKNGTETVAATGYTATLTGNLIKVDLTPETIKTLDPAQKLDITIEVKPVDNALNFGKEILNNAKVHWKLGTEEKEKEVPNEDVPKVYLHDVTVEVFKIDGTETTKFLDGATFKLTEPKSTGATIKSTKGVDLVATTGVDGKIEFKDVPLGTFWLVEEKAPEGYKSVRGHHEVVVSPDAATPTKYTVAITGTNINDDIVGPNIYSFKNYKTTSFMPATGTRGLIPYMVGAGAVALLAVFFVFGRKREKESVK